MIAPFSPALAVGEMLAAAGAGGRADSEMQTHVLVEAPFLIVFVAANLAGVGFWVLLRPVLQFAVFCPFV